MQTERVRGVISASKPVDWFAKESHTFYAPDGAANVIVSSEPLDLDVDSRGYADSQGDLLQQEFAGFTEHSFEPRQVFGGRSGYLRRYSWHPEDGEPVTQIQLYYAELGSGYSATATSATSDYPDVEVTLMALLDSLSI